MYICSIHVCVTCLDWSTFSESILHQVNVIQMKPLGDPITRDSVFMAVDSVAMMSDVTKMLEELGHYKSNDDNDFDDEWNDDDDIDDNNVANNYYSNSDHHRGGSSNIGDDDEYDVEGGGGGLTYHNRQVHSHMVFDGNVTDIGDSVFVEMSDIHNGGGFNV